MWYSYGCPNYEICYAESVDGICWEKSQVNPVLAASSSPAWDDDIVEYPEVQVVDGVYRLWFCGNGFGRVGYAEGVSESGVAVDYRFGHSDFPDASWSDWDSLDYGASVDELDKVQIRVTLWSTNQSIRPAVSQLKLTAD
jgi:hypothetical protein